MFGYGRMDGRERLLCQLSRQLEELLALHLRSDHFEKWLLDEALGDLTAGATGLLRELSGGAYSLTLDADTLDTVAAAIENLGATGRMVGLVTHVRELAERVPVRFDVRRGPASSTVTRTDR